MGELLAGRDTKRELRRRFVEDFVRPHGLERSGTELVTELELARSQGHCNSLEPRWWLVDVGVRSLVRDTSATAVMRPSSSDYRQEHFSSSRAPLHLRLDVGLLDRRSGSERDWLLDLVSSRRRSRPP